MDSPPHAAIQDSSAADEESRRGGIMLSPFAQKDSGFLGTSMMWKSSSLLFDQLANGRKFPSEFEPDKTGDLKHGEDAS